MHGALIPYLASFWIMGSRAQNWASNVLFPTNSTDSSAIYKLTSRVADYRNLSQINNAGYISLEIT